MSKPITVSSGKSIDDLRAHLFAAIEGVRDGSLALDRAAQIRDLAQVVINSAKVEVDFIRATDGQQSAFLAPAVVEPPKLPAGINGVTVHRIA